MLTRVRFIGTTLLGWSDEKIDQATIGEICSHYALYNYYVNGTPLKTKKSIREFFL